MFDHRTISECHIRRAKFYSGGAVQVVSFLISAWIMSSEFGRKEVCV